MIMSNIAAPAAADARPLQGKPRVPTAWDGISGGLRRHRGLLIAASAAGIGVSAGWMWLGAAAVTPLLYLLPCAAMMAMCMRGQGTSINSTVNPSPKSGNPDPGSSQ
jgi:hypothetical protein